MAQLSRSRTSLPSLAADMTRLPIAFGAVGGIVCFYSVFHLDEPRRALAYAEFRRVLRPDGHLLLAFRTEDDQTASGSARTMTDWWGYRVDLTFHFLDADAETQALQQAGFSVEVVVHRRPGHAEHQSRRGYLLARRG